MNHPILFLDRDNKTKLVPPSFFLLFRTFTREKKYNSKNVTVATVTISLCYKETN